ncbi:MAG: hypothetical protein R2844_00925 [Caldilineales bacterium]
MPISIGARLRYQLDRESDRYKEVYRQRTATERLQHQQSGGGLGIERPKLRSGSAIANMNTLIYILINLRTLQRITATSSNAASTRPDPRFSARTPWCRSNSFKRNRLAGRLRFCRQNVTDFKSVQPSFDKSKQALTRR